MQFDAHFSLTYTDGAGSVAVSAARVIHYIPAADHARPNEEIRFTFHDGAVQRLLRQNDILEFTRNSSGDIHVNRVAPGSRGSRRYDWIV